MKMTHRILYPLVMMAGLLLGLASLVVQPTLRYLAAGCDSLANGIDKLDRELAHKFAEDVQHASGVASGLQRESNGFRQSSATDSPAMGAMAI